MRKLALLALLLVGLLGWLVLYRSEPARVTSAGPAAKASPEPEPGPTAELIERTPAASREGLPSVEPPDAAPKKAAALEPHSPAAAGASAWFQGQVLAAENDLPLADVLVSGPEGQAARSDASGNFTLPLPSAANGIFELRHPDRSRGRFRVPRTAGPSDPPLRLRLGLAAALVGKVSGHPSDKQAKLIASFPGYLLTCGGEALFDLDTETLQAEISADGTFELAGLPPEVPLGLEVVAGRSSIHRPPEALVLQAGERRSVTWSLGRSAEVRVRVTDSNGNIQPNSPLELFAAGDETNRGFSAKHWAEIGSARTDVAGIAVFRGVSSGSFLVAPARGSSAEPQGASEDAPATMCVPFEVPSGAEVVDVDLVIHRGLWIRGHVRNGDGEPFKGILVSVFELNAKGYLDDLTDDSGGFAAGPLVPGRYRVQALVFAAGGWSAPAPIEVDAGVQDLELTLVRGSQFQVRLVDAVTGASAAGRVFLQHLDEFGFRSVIGDQTTHQFDGISPGRYHLIGRSSTGTLGCLKDVRIEAGLATVPLELPLHPAGEVRLRYEGPEEYASVQVVQDGVWFHFDGLRSGTSDVVSAPLGTCTVRFTRRPAGASEKEWITHEETVFVSPSATAEVRYVVDEGK